MAKRVVIVHGWRGRPDKGWLKWLADELTSRGIEVVAPQLPVPHYPTPEEWVEELQQLVGHLDEDTVLVGHSMGVPVILRLLNEASTDAKVGGVVLVAGFFSPPEDDHHKWFGPVPDWDKLKAMVRCRVCIFSNNDHMVKPAKSRLLAQALDAQAIEIAGRKHFGNNEDKPLQEALDAVLVCLDIA